MEARWVPTPICAMGALLVAGAMQIQALAAFDASCFKEANESIASQRLRRTDIDTDGKLFDSHEIVFSEQTAKELGIKKIIKRKELGSGKAGTVYEVDAISTLGESRIAAWKETHNKLKLRELRLEASGMKLQRELSEESRHFLKVHEHIRLQKGKRILADGYLLELATGTLFEEMEDGAEFSFYDKNGYLIEDPALLKKRIETAFQFTVQMSQALDYLRQKRLVHQDLKPENVGYVIDEPGKAPRIVLLDLGLMELLGTFHSGGTGTPEYMAPESVTAHAISTATDRYALSVMLTELFTGIAPTEPKRLSRHYYPRPGFSPDQAKSELLKVFKSIRSLMPKQEEELDRLLRVMQFALDGLAIDPQARSLRVFRENP